VDYDSGRRVCVPLTLTTHWRRFFYAGLARRKSSLALVFQSLMVISVISFQVCACSSRSSPQWFLWGFSLAFSHTASAFIGNFDNFGMMNTLGAPSVGSNFIPDLLFCIFQLVFAAYASTYRMVLIRSATAQDVMGAALERGALVPSFIFIFTWSTLVYDPIACWVWNPNGWLYKLGMLDFAGGGPVHICAGSTGLAYALVLSRRRDREGRISPKVPNYRPHNTSLMCLGIVLIWFGWFGFNGGSALNATLRSTYAATNTNLAASCAVLTWVLMDRVMVGKWSAVAAASGALAGLIGMAPPPQKSVAEISDYACLRICSRLLCSLNWDCSECLLQSRHEIEVFVEN
jgi:Amt family ammonium transporter